MKKIFFFGLLAAAATVAMLSPSEADTKYCRDNISDVLCMAPNTSHKTFHQRMLNSNDYRVHHRAFHRMHNMPY
jgi:hypothetical protein